MFFKHYLIIQFLYCVANNKINKIIMITRITKFTK